METFHLLFFFFLFLKLLQSFILTCLEKGIVHSRTTKPPNKIPLFFLFFVFPVLPRLFFQPIHTHFHKFRRLCVWIGVHRQLINRTCQFHHICQHPAARMDQSLYNLHSSNWICTVKLVAGSANQRSCTVIRCSAV